MIWGNREKRIKDSPLFSKTTLTWYTLRQHYYEKAWRKRSVSGNSDRLAAKQQPTIYSQIVPCPKRPKSDRTQVLKSYPSQIVPDRT